MKYNITIEQDEDGMYVAECSSLPGCISQGKTIEEAFRSIEDAIKGYLESLKKHNEYLFLQLACPKQNKPNPNQKYQYNNPALNQSNCCPEPA